LIGLEVLDLGPGWSKTRLEHREDLSQPAGILHGGVMASLIDTGIAHALLMTDRFHELRADKGALVSVDLRVKFLRPVSEASVICDSKVLRLGRQIIHAEAVVTGPDGREVALGDAIYMAVAGERLKRSAEGDGSV
jgi:uncharacterized protein (TIGR00369 family)